MYKEIYIDIQIIYKIYIHYNIYRHYIEIYRHYKKLTYMTMEAEKY